MHPNTMPIPCYIKNCQCVCASLSDDFVSLYTKDIDMEKLKLQLKFLPDFVKTVILDSIPIHQVTGI